MIDLIANLLVYDVYDKSGVKYTNSEKRALLERYILVNTNRLTIINAGPKLFGQFLDISTPEAKAKSKQAIKDFFNTVTPYQVVTADEARARLAKNKGKIVTDFKGATPNDILQSTDETTGEPIFRTLVNTTMNITQAGMQNGNHFSLTPRAEGGMTIAMIPGGYVEQYIKNNFKLNKLLNGQNELVALNAYLTFSPVAFETGKLDLEQEVKDEEELSKDAEDAGIDTKEQTPEQIEADVVIELATIQANNKAKSKGKKATKVEILNEIKTRFDINIMTADYTFEFAQQVLDAIKEKYKLSAVQYKAFQEIINNYLRPTAAPASSTPVVLSIEEIRAELQAKYDRAMANATRSQDLPIIAKAKQRLDEYNAKHPKLSPEERLDLLNSMNAQLAASFANVVMPNQNVELDNPTEQKVDPPSASDKKRQRTSRKANTSRITQAKKDDENKTDNTDWGKQLSDDDWNKTVVQRSNGTITEKQLQEAKAWYENHPMSKLVPFREMFDAVNSQDRNSIATFSRNGIVL
jgi:hypothetical protein